ncbi:MAG: ATP-dependent RecD-like DNA helicase [Firmicutes bacterium]|nr:ATP-dependent RecD-like DNA helicase [Bacillota bacterium]
MDNKITISGIINEIIYQNCENGYTVCELDSSTEGLVTATGYMPCLTEGTNVALTGSWTTHPDYGEQFKVDYFENIMPTDEQSIISYLSSGAVYGVRESTAQKIVEKFGTDSLEIMLTDPLRLAEIKGISKARAEKIGASYLELQSMQSIIMFLQPYNISSAMAIKVHQTLGSNAVSIIRENPYILADTVDGISFKTADNIAYIMGFPKNSPLRIQSGIKYILNSAAYNAGHTYLPKNLLLRNAAVRLSISTEEVENGIVALELAGIIFVERSNDTERCYLYSFYEAENYVARRLTSLVITPPPVSMTDEETDAAILEAESEGGMKLNFEQKLAVRSAVTHGCIVITGGPGTGKTTTINTIIKTLEKMQLSIALAAPTGRAAKRMSQLTGREAKTIHRLLGLQPGNTSESHRFSHNESNPLSHDVFIIDEVSMVDILLMQSFLKAVKRGAKVIFSGDSDQLPSVGAGNVLRDMIKSGFIPVIRLEHIFRQAQESLIVMNAHKINSGEMPELDSHDSDFFFLQRNSAEIIAATIIDLYKNRIPKSYGINPITGIQVLSPSKKGVAGVINLNRELQTALNPPDMLKSEFAYGKTFFRVGDKVMQTKNNYDIIWSRPDGEVGTGIFNGDLGIIDSISVKDKTMTIIFDDDKETEYSFTYLEQLDLAYAITVHKSQGSEFPVVIIPIYHFAPMLMYRNLLYTGVTRAKTLAILVGTKQACTAMIKKNDDKTRYSGLSEKIKSITNMGFTEDKKQ